MRFYKYKLANMYQFLPANTNKKEKCKQDTNTKIYLQEFLRLQNIYSHSTPFYTDVSILDESLGAAIISEEEAWKFKLPTPSSIFTGEMTAIQKTIQMIENINIHNKHYTIYTDSLSALQEINNIFPTNSITQRIQQTLHNIKTQQHTQITLVWIPSHVGITGNKKADRAAKEARKLNTTEDLSAQLYDIIALLKRQINDKYKKEWADVTNNKLKQIVQEKNKLL